MTWHFQSGEGHEEVTVWELEPQFLVGWLCSVVFSSLPQTLSSRGEPRLCDLVPAMSTW